MVNPNFADKTVKHFSFRVGKYYKPGKWTRESIPETLLQ